MASWLPGVLVALVGIIPAILVWGQAGRARKQSASKATRDDVREAFDQARTLWEGSVQEAQRRIESCNKRIVSLEGDIEAARQREKGLRQRVARLEEALRRAGLQVPNGSEGL
jgi:predicted  nucleic acid-binding Zn-ribbon protein